MLFNILNEISEYVTFVQLIDSLGNANYDISIGGHWIFDSNYKRALFLTQNFLDIICSPSVGEEQVANFRSVCYAVGYIWAQIHLKMGQT